MAEDADQLHTPSERNREVIERLRWKRSWSRGWFIFWLALIPATLLGGCGIPWLLPGNPFENPWALVVGLFGPLVGLGGVILMANDRYKYRRSYELALRADEWGLTYVERPGKEQYGFIREFMPFRGATMDAAWNFMSGPTNDGELVVVDFICQWGYGARAAVVRQTVIVLCEVLTDVPDFLICPRGRFDKIKEAVGLSTRPLPIDGDEEFNQAYGLFARASTGAVDRVSPALRELCVAERKLTLALLDGSLLLYWANTYIKPLDLPARLETARQVLALLRSAGNGTRSGQDTA